MVSDVPHPSQESFSVNLVNGEVVLLEELIKLQADQFNIDVGHTFLAHDQPLVFRQPAPGFSRIVVPHVESVVLKPQAWECLSRLASATTSEFVVKNCQGHLVPLGADEGS